MYSLSRHPAVADMADRRHSVRLNFRPAGKILPWISMQGCSLKVQFSSEAFALEQFSGNSC